MKTIFYSISMAMFCAACQTPTVKSTQQEKNAMSYDSTLAQQYGADDYGMKQYVMAFLYAGPNRTQDSAKAMELQMAHLSNISRLADEGKLVLAGPFLSNDSLRGIYIFNVITIDEAKQLTETDPAIQAGSLVMELKPWYGSAALMGVNKTHDSLAKQGIPNEDPNFNFYSQTFQRLSILPIFQ